MNQRVLLTKKLLKESLLKLLRTKKIQQINVKELCQNAGINRSTFYAHYGEPRDVLLEIEGDLITEIAKLAPKDSGMSPKERLLKMCEYLYEHVEMERILFRNNSDEDIAKLLGTPGFSVWKAENYFGENLAMDEEDREFISVFLNYGMYHVLRRWLTTDTHRTPDEIAALIGKIILK